MHPRVVRFFTIVTSLVVAALALAPAQPSAAASDDRIEVRATDFAVSVATEDGGLRRAWTTGDDVAVDVRTSSSLRSVSVTVRPANGSVYSFNFASPRSESLREQRYTGTERIPGRNDTPSADQGFDGFGCNTSTGTFDVHRLEPDLSQVWISWSSSCRESQGEIRIGVPEPSADVRLLPRTMEWNTRRTGTSSDTVPVRVTNTGTTATGVEDVRVGEGGADYSARAAEGCDVIAPGATCRVDVTYAPTGRQDGPRRGEVVVTTVDGARHRVALVGAALAGRWRVDARDGDGVRYVTGPDRLKVYSDGPGGEIDLSQLDREGLEPFGLYLSPGAGQEFRTGRTYVVRRSTDPRPSDATFTVALQHEVCNGWGTFRFDQLSFTNLDRTDDLNRLDRMALTFDWRCPGGLPGARGTVEYHVDQPLPPAGAPGSVRLRPAGAPPGSPRADYLPYGEKALVRADVAPRGRGGCVRLTVQHHLDRVWQSIGQTTCRPVDARGVVRLPSRTEDLHRKARVRVRALWRTGPTTFGRELVETPWTYLMVQ